MNKKIVHVELTRAEMWILRIVILAVTAIAVTIWTTTIQVQKELEVTRPSDVLKAVHAVKDKIRTDEEIRIIVHNEAPWSQVEDEWGLWRQDINKKLLTTAELQAATAVALQNATKDRITPAQFEAFQKDFKQWVALFKSLNPDFKIPEVN